MVMNNSVWAQEDSLPAVKTMQVIKGLLPLDWIVIGLYFLIVVGVGFYYSKKQKTATEYFLGSRTMGSLLVGVSMIATLVSSISYLSRPGEMIRHGPTIFTAVFAKPFIYIILGYVFVPIIMRHKATSTYELLENRLGLTSRLLGSGIFIAIRMCWMALMIYLASKCFVVMINWPMNAIPWVIAVWGSVTILYTSMGGLRAVVITDAIQFIVLLIGMIFPILYVTIKLGGFGAWWPTAWQPNWDVQPFFSWDPHTRVTVIGTIISYMLLTVCEGGSDQVIVQRYLATKNAKTARRARLYNELLGILITVLAMLVGLALLGFFQARPELIPSHLGLKKDADFLFPYFMANFVPVGMSGLLIAALLAAAMSSISSGMNSISTVVMIDFIQRFCRQDQSETKTVKLARQLVIYIGVGVILLAMVIGKVPGNIVEMAAKTSSLLVTPLFSLFFMAFFIRFATGFGSIIGLLYGVFTAVLVAYWDVFTGRTAFSFQWIPLVSLVVNIIAGVLFSLVPVKDKNWKYILVWAVIAIIPLILGAYAVHFAAM